MLTPSFLVFMSIATIIAGIGILLDAPILIVGAMVVGPEYGPSAALCVSIVRRRRRPALRAGRHAHGRPGGGGCGGARFDGRLPSFGVGAG